jgi:hypothetical protein
VTAGGEKIMTPRGTEPRDLFSSYLLSHLNAYWQAIRIFIFLLSVLLAGEGFDTALKKYAQHPHTFFSWLWSFVLLRTFRIGHGRI